MSKPLVIKLREAKANITESVNAARNSGIPFYLLEPIVAEMHSLVSNAAQKEYEQALNLASGAEKEKKGADPK